jgi:hypothetical protein
MPTCAEIREQVCEMLCLKMPRDLALVVLDYWDPPKDCRLWPCHDGNRWPFTWWCCFSCYSEILRDTSEPHKRAK